MMEELSSSSSESSSTPTPTRPNKKRKRIKRVRTKAPPIPNFQRCLFCLGTCILSTKNGGKTEGDADGGTGLIIPGAGTSLYLKRHLEKMFILRKLLDMPFIWCQETLQECTEKVLEEDKQRDPDKEENEEEDDDKLSEDLNDWFNLCVKCSKRWVQPGWEIHQKILALEAELNLIKETVRDTMKQRILQNKRNQKWSGMTGIGVAVRVRQWIFPDLIVLKAGLEEEEEEAEKIIQPKARPRPSYKMEPELVTPDDPQDDNFNDDLLMGQGHDPDQDFPSPCPSPQSSCPSSPSPPPPSPKAKSPVSKKSKSSGSPKKGDPAAAAPRKKRIRVRKPRRNLEDLKKFKCSLCSSYFRTSEDRESHLKLHEQSEKLFVCSECTFPALTQVDLDLHIKNRHERKKVRKCTWENCKFTCRSFVKLEKHLMDVHQDGDLTAVEAFNCESCGRTFSKRVAFTIHQKKSHPELFGAELGQPVECDKCGEKFVSRILLGYHVENVHRFGGPQRFQCDECGKGFNERSYLDRHLIKHVNKTKRDFVCDICGLDYAYKSLLQEHYKKIHGGDKGGILEGEGGGEIFKCRFCEVTSPFKVVIDRHLKEHKEEMGNKCRKCGRCYVSESGLKRHIRLSHGKEKITVECPWCRKGFPSRDYMRVHERLYCKLKGVGGEGGSEGRGGDGVGSGEGVEVKLNFC